MGCRSVGRSIWGVGRSRLRQRAHVRKRTWNPVRNDADVHFDLHLALPEARPSSKPKFKVCHPTFVRTFHSEAITCRQCSRALCSVGLLRARSWDAAAADHPAVWCFTGNARLSPCQVMSAVQCAWRSLPSHHAKGSRWAFVATTVWPFMPNTHSSRQGASFEGFAGLRILFAPQECTWLERRSPVARPRAQVLRLRPARCWHERATATFGREPKCLE
jgi:hypothetical protein